MSRRTITHEWDFETVDEHGDVKDHHFAKHLPDLAGHKGQTDGAFVLVRSVWTDQDGVIDRQWAYVDEDGKLPDTFDRGARIPVRFRLVLETFRGETRQGVPVNLIAKK